MLFLFRSFLLFGCFASSFQALGLEGVALAQFENLEQSRTVRPIMSKPLIPAKPSGDLSFNPHGVQDAYAFHPLQFKIETEKKEIRISDLEDFIVSNAARCGIISDTDKLGPSDAHWREKWFENNQHWLYKKGVYIKEGNDEYWTGREYGDEYDPWDKPLEPELVFDIAAVVF